MENVNLVKGADKVRDDYARNVAGAIYNLLVCNNYGRVTFASERFNISRSTLYRKKAEFNKYLCKSPGHPFKEDLEIENDELKEKICKLEIENRDLRQKNEEDKLRYENGIKKLLFLLIGVGLSGRVIAWLLKTAFKLEKTKAQKRI